MGIFHPLAIFISFFPFFLPSWLCPSRIPGVTATKPEARARLSVHPFQKQLEPSPSLSTKEESSGKAGDRASILKLAQCRLCPLQIFLPTLLPGEALTSAGPAGITSGKASTLRTSPILWMDSPSLCMCSLSTKRRPPVQLVLVLCFLLESFLRQ